MTKRSLLPVLFLTVACSSAPTSPGAPLAPTTASTTPPVAQTPTAEAPPAPVPAGTPVASASPPPAAPAPEPAVPSAPPGRNACEQIATRCHGNDSHGGLARECHLLGHNPKTSPATCEARRTECLAVCTGQGHAH